MHQTAVVDGVSQQFLAFVANTPRNTGKKHQVGRCHVPLCRKGTIVFFVSQFPEQFEEIYNFADKRFFNQWINMIDIGIMMKNGYCVRICDQINLCIREIVPQSSDEW